VSADGLGRLGKVQTKGRPAKAALFSCGMRNRRFYRCAEFERDRSQSALLNPAVHPSRDGPVSSVTLETWAKLRGPFLSAEVDRLHDLQITSDGCSDQR